MSTLTVVPDAPAQVTSSLIDQIVRDGARSMLAAALQAEVAAYIEECAGERMRFSSAILPPWARKSPQVAELLPLLYLHGVSTGRFGPALGQFLGSHAGLSASTITRLITSGRTRPARS